MFHAIHQQFARVFFPLPRNTSIRNSLRQGYNYCRNGTDDNSSMGIYVMGGGSFHADCCGGLAACVIFVLFHANFWLLWVNSL